MSRRTKLAVVTGLLILGCALWLLTPADQVGKSTAQEPKTEPTQAASPAYLTTTAPRQEPGGPYQGLSDSRWPVFWANREKDPSYEWKTPIEFYGKVVDQDANPVAGVAVSMDWTDTSPKGTSKAERTTDSAGLFSITGIRGKNFGVRSLIKDGYVPFSRSNPHSFEYAGFWEPSYHIPDKANPVIFRLKKKGEPAPLIASGGKFVLAFGTPASIPMPQAAESASPVKVTVFDIKTRQWKARITVDGGGVMPALDEFPFKAPKEGYQPSIDLDQNSPRPPGWQDLHEGGWFYIKTDRGYGLLKLRQIAGKKTLHYEVLINSAGGVNLEPADGQSFN